MAIFKSKKFWVLITTAAVECVLPFLLTKNIIDADTLHMIMGSIGAISLAYLGGQGLADFGKENK